MRFSWQAMRRTACFAAVLIVLGVVTGCGGGKGKVTGTVTGPDGKPLPLGKISFTPTSGPPGASADIEDGKYTAENVGTGENKVSVETAYIDEETKWLETSNTSQLTGTGTAGPPPKDAPPEMVKMAADRAEALKLSKEKRAKFRPIPEKYADLKTSGLSVTIKSGDNTFNVDLKK